MEDPRVKVGSVVLVRTGGISQRVQITIVQGRAFRGFFLGNRESPRKARGTERWLNFNGSQIQDIEDVSFEGPQTDANPVLEKMGLSTANL